jgi:hypothetical protein
MNDDFQFDPYAAAAEALDEGGTWLLDLVSAVDHLRRGYRPGFTVWDAFDEARRWASTGVDADEGRSSGVPVTSLVASEPDKHGALQGAVRVWVLVMAERYNGGCHWPHPSPRRGFPPPRLDRA